MAKAKTRVSIGVVRERLLEDTAHAEQRQGRIPRMGGMTTDAVAKSLGPPPQAAPGSTKARLADVAKSKGIPPAVPPDPPVTAPPPPPPPTKDAPR